MNGHDATSLLPLTSRGGRQKGWLVAMVRDGPWLRLADIGSWHDRREDTIPEYNRK